MTEFVANGTIFLSFTWSSGTLAEQFRRLGKWLREEGYDVIAICQPDRKPHEAHHFSAVYPWASKRGTSLTDAGLLAHWIRKHRPICVIGNFSTVNVVLILGWLSRVPVRIAWYHSMHSAFPTTGSRLNAAFRLRRRRMVYRLATHLIAVSRATRDDIVENYRVPSSKIRVLYNGAPGPSTWQQSDVPERNRLVCVATLERWKGQDVLIRAVSLISKDFPNLKVEFLGDGSQMKRSVELADELDVARHCVFLGLVHPREVGEHFRRAWASVLPSRSDSFPVVVLEAMACGVPTVASAVGGIPEAIEDGVTGFLVPPGDPEALAERLRRILSDRELRDTLGKAARRRLEEQFELDVVTRHQARVISELIQQTRDVPLTTVSSFHGNGADRPNLL